MGALLIQRKVLISTVVLFSRNSLKWYAPLKLLPLKGMLQISYTKRKAHLRNSLAVTKAF